MPKILPNRISNTLSNDKLTAINEAIQVIIDNLGTPVSITNDDYKALAKLGDVLKPICDDVFDVIKENPNYLEDEQPIEEVQKDKTHYEQLTNILKSLNNAVFLYERQQGTTGAEYRNAIHNYEGNVKEKVKKGNAIAQLTLDKLNRIDRGVKPTPQLTPVVK